MRVAQPGALSVLGVALAVSPVRADVGDYLGRPVTSVQLSIEGTPARDPQLRELAETREGQPLSLGAVRRTIGHLFSLGRFENVAADAADAPGGVALRYELTPVHPIQRLTFTGTAGSPGIDEGDLRRELRIKRPRMRCSSS
jgi:hypothetical protein